MGPNMSENNLNKDLSWKCRLAELESLSGETSFDKKTSWNRLHTRMQDKPVSKKRYWYWAAAACILAVLILPFTQQKNQNTNVAKQHPVQVSSDTGIINNVLSNDKLNSLSIVIKKELPVANSAKKTASPTHHTIQIIKQSVIEEVQPVITIVASTPFTDSNKTSTAVVLPKKKLSIVHINELSINNTSPTVGNSFSNTLRRFIRPSNKDMSIDNPAKKSYNGDHILIQNINPQIQN